MNAERRKLVKELRAALKVAWRRRYPSIRMYPFARTISGSKHGYKVTLQTANDQWEFFAVISPK